VTVKQEQLNDFIREFVREEYDLPFEVAHHLINLANEGLQEISCRGTEFFAAADRDFPEIRSIARVVSYLNPRFQRLPGGNKARLKRQYLGFIEWLTKKADERLYDNAYLEAIEMLKSSPDYEWVTPNEEEEDFEDA